MGGSVLYVIWQSYLRLNIFVARVYALGTNRQLVSI